MAQTTAAPITTEIARITPRDAERYLGRNSHNRNLKPTTVARLSGAIKRGEWQLNGESIKFSATGSLLDGQHRLQAIVDAGQAVETIVVRGLPETAQDTVDIGVKRSSSDILRLHGYTDTNVLGSALVFLHRMRTKQWYSGAGWLSPTPQELMALLEQNAGIVDSVHTARRLTSRVRLSRSLATALHFRFSEIDKVDADAFFERLTTGEDLHSGNPIYAFRRWLEQTGAINKAASPAVVYAIAVKSWNAFRHNEDMALARYRRGIDQWPEPE